MIRLYTAAFENKKSQEQWRDIKLPFWKTLHQTRLSPQYNIEHAKGNSFNCRRRYYTNLNLLL